MEERWRALIKGESQGWIACTVRGFLWLISLVYAAITSLRNWAYDCHLFASKKPENAFCISVGNLTLGGSGKTPLVMLLAKELQAYASVAILSRGYRRQAEKTSKPLIVSTGEGPLHPSAISGDEPYLLAQCLPGVKIIVGPNRQKTAEAAVQMGCQLLLCDDALQHRRLARDIDIVVVDARAPFGYGGLFPSGTLRESVRQGLARATFIVIQNVHSHAQYEAIRQQLTRYSTAPCTGMCAYVDHPPELLGRKVGIFCGIAHPERFLASVRDLGAEVVDTLYSPDHCLPTEIELHTFAEKCLAKGATRLICTEKDRVKVPASWKLRLPITALAIALKPVAGQQSWEDFLISLKSQGGRRTDRGIRCE